MSCDSACGSTRTRRTWRAAARTARYGCGAWRRRGWCACWRDCALRPARSPSVPTAPGSPPPVRTIPIHSNLHTLIIKNLINIYMGWGISRHADKVGGRPGIINLIILCTRCYLRSNTYVWCYMYFKDDFRSKRSQPFGVVKSLTGIDKWWWHNVYHILFFL